MENFETDAMDDLMIDGAEGVAAAPDAAEDEFDDFDEFDELDGFDEFDEGDDEFLAGLLPVAGKIAGGLFGGRRKRRRAARPGQAAPAARAPAGGGLGGLGGLAGLLGSLLSADDFDEGDAFDEGDGFDPFDEGDEFDSPEAFDEGDEFDGFDAFDEGDELDAADEIVAEALDAGDSDEFLRRLGGFARRVGRGVGRVARVVAPIASMIPLPQAQLIGRLAGVAGRLLADGADEFEAFDEMVDGMDADEIDAAAPLIAGLALRRALPAVARMAAPARRQLVGAASTAIRRAVRSRGRLAARVVPRALVAARRVAAQRRVPVRRAVPSVVNRITTAAVRRPQAVRVLSRPLVPAARRATPPRVAARIVRRVVAPIRPQVKPMVRTIRRRVPIVVPAVGARRCICPRHGRAISIRGPVTIRVRAR